VRRRKLERNKPTNQSEKKKLVRALILADACAQRQRARPGKQARKPLPESNSPNQDVKPVWKNAQRAHDTRREDCRDTRQGASSRAPRRQRLGLARSDRRRPSRRAPRRAYGTNGNRPVRPTTRVWLPRTSLLLAATLEKPRRWDGSTARVWARRPCTAQGQDSGTRREHLPHAYGRPQL
jgi:hypothetical protein